MKKSIGLLLLVLIFSSCSHDPQTLLEKLQELPDIAITEITPPEGYLQAFQIDVSQPMDHNIPQGAKFNQRIFLSHMGDDRPTVLYHSGYGVGRNYLGETTKLLNANQILVTHRYFPNARPQTLRWDYLNIWQASCDHHRIVELFKRIYKGKWVSTGVSKGGMTALFDRRFFPTDVDVTVAYVAPIMSGTEDPRFGKYLLEEAGTPEAREKIKSFQRLLLSNRSALLPLVANYASQNNYTYLQGAEAAFEYAVMEYLFAFWQYGDGDVSKIPGPEAGAQAWFNHLTAVSGLYYYTDVGIAYFEPFFYQAYTELGYCPYYYDHLKYLLTAVNAPTYRVFAPANTVMNFNAVAMQDVSSWLRDQGNHIIYIYGGNDPYTVAAAQPSENIDALRIIQPGANHGAKIANLDERARVIQKLNQWLGMTLAVTDSQWKEAGEAHRELFELFPARPRL